MRSRVKSQEVAGLEPSASTAPRKPPIPEPMTLMAMTPKTRKRSVWNVLTHAVPRIPPKKT